MSDITEFHALLRSEIEETLAEFFHIGVEEVDSDLTNALFDSVKTIYEGR
jgi:hypothetical protein